MPGFDRKGPLGDGPMTGCRLGRCTGFGRKQPKNTQAESQETNPENFEGRGFGFGRRGRGRGRGVGFRNRFRGGE